MPRCGNSQTGRPRWGRVVAALAVAAAAVIGLPARGPVSADRGDLDPTFGEAGHASTGLPSSSGQGYSIALDPATGRIYAGAIGVDPEAGSPRPYVAAFTPDGTLDTSFGADGIAYTGRDADSLSGVAVAVSPAGDRVYLAAMTIDAFEASESYVAAFTPTGSLDTGFGLDGIAGTGMLPSAEGGHDLAVDPVSGEVYLAALTVEVPSATVGMSYVAAFTPAGALDPVFGDEGIAIAGPAFYRDGFALALDPASGRLYLATSGVQAGDATNVVGVLVAFTSTGGYDDSFGSNGYTPLAVPVEASGRYGIALDTERDRIYVASWDATVQEEPNTPVVMAYGSDGITDTEFGDGGVVHSAHAGSDESGQSVVVDPAGVVYLVTYAAGAPFTDQVYVAAFTPDGGAEETFGASGFAGTGVVSSASAGSRAVVDPAAGRLYVAGFGGAEAMVSAFDLADTPEAVADVGAVVHDRPLGVSAPGVLANDTAPAGAELEVTSFDSVSAAGGAVAVTVDGAYTYTPPAGYVGDDTFSYTVADTALGRTASATVTVTVTNAVPVPPDTSPAYTTPFEQVLEVPAPGMLSGVTDADGDELSVDLADGEAAAGASAAPLADAVPLATGTTPAGASVTLNADGSFTYSPPAGFSGVDQVAYTVTDGIDATTVQTATVTVGAPVPDTTTTTTSPSGSTTTPPALPVTTVPPAPGETPELPATGSNSIPPWLIAGVLLVGTAACTVARRRSHG